MVKKINKMKTNHLSWPIDFHVFNDLLCSTVKLPYLPIYQGDCGFTACLKALISLCCHGKWKGFCGVIWSGNKVLAQFTGKYGF